MSPHPGHVRTVSIPSVPFGPEGADPAAADESFYRAAAYNIRYQAARGNAFAGSNLTEAVAKLCEAAAGALIPSVIHKSTGGSDTRSPLRKADTMSKPDTTSEMLLKIDNYKPSTDVITQYGMVYPDGTMRWGQDNPSSLNPVVFRHLHEGATNAVRRWAEDLERKARDASMDLAEYRSQFRPVKRTVIVAVTDSEDI